jgi:hypothetical protein
MALELLTRDSALDVAPDIKRQLIEQDAQMWRNTRWQAESRRRVYKRIGNTEAEAEQIKILEQCESALMELAEQAKDL